MIDEWTIDKLKAIKYDSSQNKSIYVDGYEVIYRVINDNEYVHIVSIFEFMARARPSKKFDIMGDVVLLQLIKTLIDDVWVSVFGAVWLMGREIISLDSVMKVIDGISKNEVNTLRSQIEEDRTYDLF